MENEFQLSLMNSMFDRRLEKNARFTELDWNQRVSDFGKRNFGPISKPPSCLKMKADSEFAYENRHLNGFKLQGLNSFHEDQLQVKQSVARDLSRDFEQSLEISKNHVLPMEKFQRLSIHPFVSSPERLSADNNSQELSLRRYDYPFNSGSIFSNVSQWDKKQHDVNWEDVYHNDVVNEEDFYHSLLPKKLFEHEDHLNLNHNAENDYEESRNAMELSWMSGSDSSEDALLLEFAFLQVTDVIAGSRAHQSGLRKGDLFIQFGKFRKDNFPGLEVLPGYVEALLEKPIACEIVRQKLKTENRSTMNIKYLELLPKSWEKGVVLGMIVDVYPKQTSFCS